MSLFIEIKYLNLLSSNLEGFKKKGESLWNFRCPICGDSEKKKNKARGYIYQREGTLFYRCHNCAFSTTFSKFLEKINPVLQQEYTKEKFLNKYAPQKRKIETPIYKEPVFKNKVEINLDSLDSLPDNHWVKYYAKNRKIPSEHFCRLFYAPDFRSFVKDMGSDKYLELFLKEPRLVIPFFDENKELFAFQGRSLLDDAIRYISIKLKEDSLFVFGLDRINKDSPVYVVEGPIDSLFLKNSIAIGSSDLNKANQLFNNLIFIFDNEPWNKEICNNMKKIILQKHKIVIWPQNQKEKDINDLVISGKDPEQIIKENIFSELEAEAKFSFWRKS